MLESSFGINFFMKTPEKETSYRYIYLRLTVDGVRKETSTKKKWDPNRWHQKSERATGTKEDARTINYYLDTLTYRLTQFATELVQNGKPVTVHKLMDFVTGKIAPKVKVIEEFDLHNKEMLALVDKGDYAYGTYQRFITARSHVKEYLMYKYGLEDIDFRDLNFEFVKDYDFYLRTVKNCNNNTTVKYITNFKKIVLRAVDKEIIASDPFSRYKGKKVKTNKKPLSAPDLRAIELHNFTVPRLEEVRSIFIFQCYTGLAYIDAFQLKPTDIKPGIDGELWIMSARQKTNSETNIPLLPKALEIIEKYKKHPVCRKRGCVLPVRSNQKMNAYLKEIAGIVGITCELNTHKARRTFGSTVTLANDVPIHIVKEMLGHQSVKQTEEYAITEQRNIGFSMKELKQKLVQKESPEAEVSIDTIMRMEAELNAMKKKLGLINKAS